MSRLHTKHLENGEPGASLLRDAPYLHPQHLVVAALTSSPPAAAASPSGTVFVADQVVAGAALERRAPYGAGDQRVQDADDDHRDDEEDDARRREEMLQVRDGCLGPPPESTHQTTSRSVQPFCRSHTHIETNRPRCMCSNRPHGEDAGKKCWRCAMSGRMLQSADSEMARPSASSW